jgi:mannose-6-phosphate isomerase-like protein (cupin superfamily)
MRSPTGNRIAIRADGTQTGGVFSLLETEDVAGAATPPYVHTREDEAYLILEGRYRFHCAEDSGCAPQTDLPPRFEQVILYNSLGSLMLWR